MSSRASLSTPYTGRHSASAREPRRPVVAQPEAEAPEVVARLRLVPAPDHAPARLLRPRAERRRREVRQVARQLESRPRAAEDPRAEPARVRHLDHEQAARREPAEHPPHRAHRVGHVLEHVERGDHVELARRERRRLQIAGVHPRGEAARLRGRRRVHLDPGHLPAERGGHPERSARAAAHVEIAPAPAPRRAVPAQAAQQQARAQPGEGPGAGRPPDRVAELARRAPSGPRAPAPTRP